MPEKVFLSSTYKDLVEHRAAVSRALLRESFFPVDMINFTASPEEPLEACLNEVAASELFIGIYARRYGFRPPGFQVSITEQELREARDLGKDCFCFLLAESHPWPEDADHVDSGESAERLQALKADIRLRQVIDEFTTPEDLALKVMTALHNWESDKWRSISPTPERRELLKLLDSVDREIEISFERSQAPRAGLFPLELEERLDAVASPKELLRRDTHEIARRRRRPVSDVFEEQSGRLLILGKAGGGKTILLLQLARWLGGRARRDAERPVPVVLTLAAWKRSDGDLGDFLVREISQTYHFPRRTVASWLADGKIVALLDGLDEVAEDSRLPCVAAINQLLDERPESRLVVCCRSSFYSRFSGPSNRLTKPDGTIYHRFSGLSGLKLRLDGAVEVCPLDPGRLTGAFERIGTESFRTALAADGELRELARTPLILALMENLFTEEGPAALASEPGASIEKRRQQVIERFIGHLLKRDKNRRRTRLDLAWLAARLEERSSRLFRVAQLQPTWLASGSQVWTYAVVSRALGGFLLALPLAAAMPILFNGRTAPWLLAWGLAAGAFAGVLDAIRLRRVIAGKMPRSRTAQAIAISAGALLLFELIGAAWLRRQGLQARSGLLTGLIYGPFLSLPFGLVFGLRVGWRTGRPEDTRIGEPLIWSGWSAGGARTGALLGALFPISFWGISLFSFPNVLPAAFWAFLAGLFVLVFAALGGRIGGYLSEPAGPSFPTRKKRPRGIWSALRSSGTAAVRTVAAASTLAVLALTVAALSRADPGSFDLPQSFTVAAVLCFIVTLWLRGLDFVQHLTLRLLLAATRQVPVRWVRFLRHAADLGLLRERAGSFQFFHAEVLEHFASLRPPKRPPSSH